MICALIDVCCTEIHISASPQQIFCDALEKKHSITGQWYIVALSKCAKHE